MNDFNRSFRVEEVKKSLVRRRSVRTFSDRVISAEILDDLIEAAKYAPSGSNWQNQRFLVVTDPDEIQKIGKIRFVWPYKANVEKIKRSHPGGILGHGAALILVFADASRNDARGNGEYHIWESLEIQNCSASIQNILTMAAAHGLGSCWVSASDKMNYNRMLSGKTWREALTSYDIPDYYKMQGVILLGYPKRHDEEGYALGEKMHGATHWVKTERGPNEDYLVKKRTEVGGENHPKLKKSERCLVQFYSKVIRFLLRIIKLADRKIHNIEYSRYFSGK